METSRTYKIDRNHIEGNIDGLDAVKQATSLALSVERFEYLIYSLDYGNELKGFIGKQQDYVKGDIERRINEALLQDERVESISDFSVSFEGENAYATFTVNSTFGKFSIDYNVKEGAVIG